MKLHAVQLLLASAVNLRLSPISMLYTLPTHLPLCGASTVAVSVNPSST